MAMRSDLLEWSPHPPTNVAVSSLYTPPGYVPSLFNKLPLFEDAHQTLTKNLIQQAEVSRLREIFYRHNVHTKLGLIMLHRHFALSPDERLIEYRGVATPWSVGDNTEIFGGHIVPRSWAFFEGKLYPTEFRFQAPTTSSPPPITAASLEAGFPEQFVREFYDFVANRGLDGLLGLTLFDVVGGFSGLREVERTVGRVSVTFPVIAEGGNGQDPSAETAWTFGCHERMDDSKLMNARICWVCQGCK